MGKSSAPLPFPRLSKAFWSRNREVAASLEKYEGRCLFRPKFEPAPTLTPWGCVLALDRFSDTVLLVAPIYRGPAGRCSSM